MVHNQDLNFRIGWQDDWIRTQNLEIPSKRITRLGESHLEKLTVFRTFLLFWNATPLSKKFSNFQVTLDNFLMSVIIFYCRSKMIIFLLYHELNAIQSENLEFSHEISCILPVHEEIKVYLLKMIVDLKISIAEKFMFRQLVAKIANFADIRWNNDVFTQKKKIYTF